MKNNKIYLYIMIFIFILLLPIIAIYIVYKSLNIIIFDNPDFWYGYMAYFGTTILAGVAFWQNMNANETNKRLMEQQMRQKIGYFELERDEGSGYKKLQIGNFYQEGVRQANKEDTLGIYLKNIGSDIIQNLKIQELKINDRIYSPPANIRVVYIDEIILFEIPEVKPACNEELNIAFTIEMHNLAGISYIQKILIKTQKGNHKSYPVKYFDLEILFEGENKNGQA